MQTVHFIKTEEVADKISALFEVEKTRLATLLPNAHIEHIGGTSVPGTVSKGDLDINVRVEQIDFLSTIEILRKLYEINQPANWTSGFASFKDDSRDLGIQLTVIGSDEDCFVRQRDYLKSHPDKVEELNSLKEKFEGKNMDKYRKEKSRFFKNLLL